MKIKQIIAREILDSRGLPTIETEVVLQDGSLGIASIATASSPGKYEALELRDLDPTRFKGLGVLKAVTNVNEIIAPKLLGMDASFQGEIDQLLVNLDGTAKKEKLGGNAVLSVSQAVCEASAVSYHLPTYAYLQQKYQLNNRQAILPIATFNLINGGKHGSGNLDFQEFHIIPTSRKTYHESLRCAQEIYQSLKKILIYRGAAYSVGDEGGFAPYLFTNSDALEILLEAIEEAEYHYGKEVFFGIDAAANTFFNDGRYTIKDRSQPFSREEFIKFYQDLNTGYHLFSLEDPLADEDWPGWQTITQTLGSSSFIVGDDLLCCSKDRIEKAIQMKACNAVLVKPNYLGTISETIEIIKICRAAGWKIIVSHRSGETNDDFIADFAVGVAADYTKFGAPARGERVAKYNRLLQIEAELNPNHKS